MRLMIKKGPQGFTFVFLVATWMYSLVVLHFNSFMLDYNTLVDTIKTSPEVGDFNYKSQTVEGESIAIAPVLDDLVWITPRPPEARIHGWEDSFMKEFKKRHYDQNTRLGCETTPDTPYEHERLCVVPGYIPARLVLPPTMPQRIPRTIFLLWKTRKLGRIMFSSIMTIVSHNPEYEVIIFDDHDMERFVCHQDAELMTQHSISPYLYSKLHAGASRADVIRMMLVYTYGGVYLDIDMTAMRHLPIPSEASVFSGVGGWSHLPDPSPRGVLEHWALAFEAKHLLLRTTLELIRKNLENPWDEEVHNENATKAEPSYTIRLTGPAVYQRALQRLLGKAQCKIKDNSFGEALRNPHELCNSTIVHELLGNVVIASNVDLDNSLVPGLMYPEKEMSIWDNVGFNYDDIRFRPSKKGQDDFCATLDKREADAERQFKEAIAKQQGMN